MVKWVVIVDNMNNNIRNIPILINLSLSSGSLVSVSSSSVLTISIGLIEIMGGSDWVGC